MPISRHARMTRTAISPRLAIKTLVNTGLWWQKMTPDVPLRLEVTESAPPSARAAALAPVLRSAGFAAVEWVAETGSTNADLLERGEPDRVVRITDHQTQGRGRLDRTWQTEPEAALLMSVSTRVAVGTPDLARYTTALGVAACEGVHALGFDRLGLKWPNDVVVDGPGQPKVAGVLAQSVITGDHVTVVAGIGMNVRGDRLASLVPERPTAALEDFGAPPDRVVLAGEILRRFDPEAPDLWARYRRSCLTLGQTVRVELTDEVCHGVATAVTEHGALVIETDGGPVEIVAGDVSSVRADR